jgi:hypothetical protein
MRKPNAVPQEIELHWQQWSREEWQVILVDRRSGKTYEVSAPTDLWTTLNRVLLDPAVRATGEDNDPGQHERAAEPPSDPRRGIA